MTRLPSLALALVPSLLCAGCGMGYADLTTSIVIFAIAAVVVGGAVVGFFVLRTRGTGAQHRTDDAPGWDSVDVSGIAIAVDWRFRRQLHEQLGDFAQSRKSADADDMARGIREVALALRRAETSWLYAKVVNARPASAEMARQTFRDAAEMAHSVNDRLPATPGGPAAGDPSGVAVVTLIVAARTEIPDVVDPADARVLEELLSSYVALSPRTLAQMEVIWAPEAVDGRMSLEQMRALHPDVVEIRSTTLAGRKFCASCRAPFPDAVESCPHCGA